jgi:hypothetical protein
MVSLKSISKNVYMFKYADKNMERAEFSRSLAKYEPKEAL